MILGKDLVKLNFTINIINDSLIDALNKSQKA